MFTSHAKLARIHPPREYIFVYPYDAAYAVTGAATSSSSDAAISSA